MPFEVLPSDKFFFRSPDAGDPDCRCSRCNKQISEEEAPIVRAWPEGHRDLGYVKNKSTEFRYCTACCIAMGMTFL